MKKNNTLTKIDNYFDTKKESEVSIMLIGTLFLVGFLTYLLTWDPAAQYYESVKSENQKAITDLNKAKSFLAQETINGDVNYKIKEKKRVVDGIKKDLETAKLTNQYIDDKLKKLSYLLFNEQNWAKFLDSLAFLADKNDVKITKIANDFKNPTPQKIEQVLDIKVDLNGNFQNIVGYINSIEESELVVDVNHLDINSTNKDLTGNIGIVVWGMKY